MVEGKNSALLIPEALVLHPGTEEEEVIPAHASRLPPDPYRCTPPQRQIEEELCNGTGSQVPLRIHLGVGGQIRHHSTATMTENGTEIFGEIHNHPFGESFCPFMIWNSRFLSSKL
jgi:hypothetical protein